MPILLYMSIGAFDLIQTDCHSDYAPWKHAKIQTITIYEQDSKINYGV